MSNDCGTLLELVKEHRVVFEVRPAFSMTTGRRVQIGFDIEIYGTGIASTKKMLPGDDRSFAVWEHLHDIGKTILPSKANGVVCVIEYFRPVLIFDQKRQRPDVELVLTIRHRDKLNTDVDASQEACLHRLCEALRAAGVQEGTWSDGRSARN